VLDQLLDSFPIITGRTPTDEWDGHAEQVEGSPDHLIGLDRRAFGIELTEIRGVDDAWDFVAEAYTGSNHAKAIAMRGAAFFAFRLSSSCTQAIPLYSTSSSHLRGRPIKPTSRRWALTKCGPLISATPITAQAIHFAELTCSDSSPSIGSGFIVCDHDRKPLDELPRTSRHIESLYTYRRRGKARAASLLGILRLQRPQSAHAAGLAPALFAAAPKRGGTRHDGDHPSPPQFERGWVNYRAFIKKPVRPVAGEQKGAVEIEETRVGR
jgi:hypothetical protein